MKPAIVSLTNISGTVCACRLNMNNSHSIPKAHHDEQFKLFHTIVTKAGNQKFVYVSNYGNVYQTHDYKDTIKRIKTYNTANNRKADGTKSQGYLAFSQNDWPAKYLHTAIAMLFIPNPYNLNEVNHIDSDKHNNSVGNLEWCDHSSNVKHRYGHTNYHNNYSLTAQL